MELDLKNPEINLSNIAKSTIDNSWRDFLFDIINKHGLNPWDLDISLFTKSYLESIKNLKNIDFNISAKFLVISIYLLKMKSKELLQNDIKNFEEFERETEESDFEDFPEEFENGFEKKKTYKIKLRNPFERKKKVSIFELIKELETTLKNSEIKKQRALERKILSQEKYEGPIFEKKTKNLKDLLIELIEEIEFHLNKMGHLKFSMLVDKKKHTKINILEKFIPLLHLSNQNKIILEQNKHFGEIHITKNE